MLTDVIMSVLNVIMFSALINTPTVLGHIMPTGNSVHAPVVGIHMSQHGKNN